MLILKFYDIFKIFDKETIVDAILTCKMRGADPKAVQFAFGIN